MMKQKTRILIFLIIAVTVGQLGVDLYLPSLPHIARELNALQSLIKLTIPMYLLGFGISQIIYGPFSDIMGRKPVLGFGICLFLLGSIGCFLAPTGYLLVAMRFVQGLGVGATVVNVRAITRDAFHGTKMAQVSAWISMVWAVTPIIAPVAGGYIQTYFGWRDNFIVMFIYGLLVLFALLFLLPETLPNEHKKTWNLRQMTHYYVRIFTDKIFLSFSLMSSLSSAYFFSFATASPFLLQEELGVTPVLFGWLFLLIAVGSMSGAIICHRLLNVICLKTIIFVGASVMLSASTALLFLSLSGIFTIWSIVIPMFFASLAGGMIFPNCATGAMTHYKTMAGIAGAGFGCMQMLTNFAFSSLISHLSTKSPIPLSIELMAISVIVCILFFTCIRPHFSVEKEEDSASAMDSF